MAETKSEKTVQEFIKKNAIHPIIAAGFVTHLRMQPDQEADFKTLEKEYEVFTGRKLNGESVKPIKPKAKDEAKEPEPIATGDQPVPGGDSNADGSTPAAGSDKGGKKR